VLLSAVCHPGRPRLSNRCKAPGARGPGEGSNAVPSLSSQAPGKPIVFGYRNRFHQPNAWVFRTKKVSADSR
jgi:hypothetical protein